MISRTMPASTAKISSAIPIMTTCSEPDLLSTAIMPPSPIVRPRLWPAPAAHQLRDIEDQSGGTVPEDGGTGKTS